MSNLVINRLRFNILTEKVPLTISTGTDLFFARSIGFFLEQIDSAKYPEIIAFLKGAFGNHINEDTKVSYDFFCEANNSSRTFSVELNEMRFLRKSFLKRHLFTFFKQHNFLVEPYATGVDISVYKKSKALNPQWDIFNRYDIVIYPHLQEVSVSVGSTDTIISNTPSKLSQEVSRVVDKKGTVVGGKFAKEDTSYRLIANFEKRIQLGIKNSIKKVFYQDTFKSINELYDLLLQSTSNNIVIEGGGFRTVHPADVVKLDFTKNYMEFGNNHVNVNAATGMRDGGAYYIPAEQAETKKFLFIYRNKEQANNLYLYLKKGLKHFPGLLSYVGIPLNIANERLQFSSTDRLKEEFDEFLQMKLSHGSYNDYFAIVLLPFSKETAKKSETKLYYYMKQKLLEKGIASQDLYENRINSAAFHYHLPNMAIAILAKMGGVPWKLQRKPYRELVVGFNETRIDEKVIVGTAVYFDNGGKLRQIKSFCEQGRSELISSLKGTIKEYLDKNQNNPPERLVIHYYKTPKLADVDSIQYLIRNEFRFNLPFALVEINDSKDKTDVCFDVESHYGMPVSGTVVNLNGKNEYLLFNNTRYSEETVKPVTNEEYPIKLKLYNTEGGGFTHKELISQVYEFSRLYWKGLKHKSQPVTTQYSKMISEFAAHFENHSIPINEISQNVAWFI